MPWFCTPTLVPVARAAVATVRRPILHPVKVHRAVGRAVRHHWRTHHGVAVAKARVTWRVGVACVWLGVVVPPVAVVAVPPLAAGACCAILGPGSWGEYLPRTVAEATPAGPVGIAGRVTNVPEPSGAALLAVALVGLWRAARRDE